MKCVYRKHIVNSYGYNTQHLSEIIECWSECEGASCPAYDRESKSSNKCKKLRKELGETCDG